MEIFLSPDKSLDRCYQIMINASGSVADLLSRGGAEDWSWNSGSEAKSILAPGRGWSVEIRIPRSSMDPASESGMLGNFTRRYFPPAQKPESCVWGPFYTKAHNEIFHFGTLRFQPDERKNLVDGSNFEGVRFSGSKWYWEGAGRAFPAASDYLIAGRYSALLDSARFRTDSCSITQYPDLKPDTEYELSFFVRMEDVKPSEAKSSGFYVRVDDFSKKEKCFPHRNSAAFSGTKSWTPLFFRFRTSPENDGRKPRLCFILRRAAGKVWIDHVRLEEIRSGK